MKLYNYGEGPYFSWLKAVSRGLLRDFEKRLCNRWIVLQHYILLLLTLSKNKTAETAVCANSNEISCILSEKYLHQSRQQPILDLNEQTGWNGQYREIIWKMVLNEIHSVFMDKKYFLDKYNHALYMIHWMWYGFECKTYLNCLLAKHVTRICWANISKSLKVVPHLLWIECMWFIEKTTNSSTEFSCKYSQRLKLKSFSKFSSPNYVPSLVRVSVGTAAWAWDQLWLRPSS